MVIVERAIKKLVHSSILRTKRLVISINHIGSDNFMGSLRVCYIKPAVSWVTPHTRECTHERKADHYSDVTWASTGNSTICDVCKSAITFLSIFRYYILLPRVKVGNTFWGQRLRRMIWCQLVTLFGSTLLNWVEHTRIIQLTLQCTLFLLYHVCFHSVPVDSTYIRVTLPH